MPDPIRAKVSKASLAARRARQEELYTAVLDAENERQWIAGLREVFGAREVVPRPICGHQDKHPSPVWTPDGRLLCPACHPPNFPTFSSLVGGKPIEPPVARLEV